MIKARAKSTFKAIFLLLVIALLFLPLLITFNEFLTALVLKIGWYRAIENLFLPIETRMIAIVINALGYKSIASATTVSILRDNTWQKIIISWNCIGWQSFIVLGVTFITGLQGPHTKISKLECLTIGVLGTFLLNILRISIVAILIVSIRSIPAAVIHDYSSTIMIIFWLFFFWWFSYRYILEEKPV